MFIGTAFTLFVTPAVYTFVARIHRAAPGRDEAPSVETESVAHPQPPARLAGQKAAAE
jgi:hypothetical protein